MDPRKKRTEEVYVGTNVQKCPSLDRSSGSNGVGLEESEAKSPECPPAFEDTHGLYGTSALETCPRPSLGIAEGESEVEESIEIEQNDGYFVEEVPQTPIFDPVSSVQIGDIEMEKDGEEELVETQITWDSGKTLGLIASNERAVIKALTKVPGCQDFTIPRKRGRPKKNKVRY